MRRHPLSSSFCWPRKLSLAFLGATWCSIWGSLFILSFKGIKYQLLCETAPFPFQLNRSTQGNQSTETIWKPGTQPPSRNFLHYSDFHKHMPVRHYFSAFSILQTFQQADFQQPGHEQFKFHHCLGTSTYLRQAGD